MRTEHLTEDELEALAHDEETGPDVRRHLADCATCREAAREGRFATLYVRPLAGDHPDEHVLTALWSNALPPARKKDVESHVAGCSRCRALLTRLVRATPPESSPSLIGDGWLRDTEVFASTRKKRSARSVSSMPAPESGDRCQTETEMEIVRKTLKEARLGAASAHANLAVFPLWTAAPADRPYLTLDEALSTGTVRVVEVSEQGSVPNLCVVNDTDRPVLLLDGEELRGAKQNRVLNLTILVSAGKTIVVPVSCVEQGRWSHRSAAFSSSDHVLYARSRAAKAEFISGSLRSVGRAHSDQRAVWASIEEKMARLGASSATRAMDDIYVSRRAGIDAFVAALRPEPGQTGAVFVLNGTVQGLEIFDHPDAFAAMLPKLVRSWALDAIETPPGDVSAPPGEEARAFLELVAEAEMQAFTPVGQGTDVRLSSAQVTGGALLDAGRVVHLNAFRQAAKQPDHVVPATGPSANNPPTRESWIVRASRRFRRR
jgi:hypothetical protein